ncbi:MAG: hypothetical protein RBT66_08935 [bacterium]|jgi:hypothetical protein|nr:hypothetical protein [bacterium]
MKVNQKRLKAAEDVNIYLNSGIFKNRFKVIYVDPKNLLIITANDQESMDLLHECVNVKSNSRYKKVKDFIDKNNVAALMIKGRAIKRLADSLIPYFNFYVDF